jgi:hypothetical protein
MNKYITLMNRENQLKTRNGVIEKEIADLKAELKRNELEIEECYVERNKLKDQMPDWKDTK